MLKMNLQTFAEPGGEAGGGGEPKSEGATGQASKTQQNNPQDIDYDKIASLVAGKQAATEESVLKGYFKQQGLSKEEAEQAISAFKEQKAKNQPNIEAIQQQATAAQKQAQEALIERDAYMLSSELGIDLKTMPYVLKLADLSAVVSNEGKIEQDKLKEALNKVLEDVPQLKPQEENQQNGFRQIGVGNQQQSNNTQQKEQKAVPTKRWNRWN